MDSLPSFSTLALVCAVVYIIYKYITSRPLSPQELKTRLCNKVVIVTGSARGLGKAIALHLIKNGATVVLVDLLDHVLAQTADEITRLYPYAEFLTIAADLTQSAARERVIGETVTKYGKLDILFSNHGIMPASSIAQCAADSIEKVTAVNFTSHAQLAKLAIPHLRATKGMFAVTCSMAGKTALVNLAHYCSSKHALYGFFDVLRLEEQCHGVSVTVLSPGAMRTELIRDGFGADPNEGRKSKTIKFSEPADLAPGMVNAVLTRTREHYTDCTLRYAGLVRALFPHAVDAVLGRVSAKMYTKSPSTIQVPVTSG